MKKAICATQAKKKRERGGEGERERMKYNC
jgi:hypothetical protein